MFPEQSSACSVVQKLPGHIVSKEWNSVIRRWAGLPSDPNNEQNSSCLVTWKFFAMKTFNLDLLCASAFAVAVLWVLERSSPIDPIKVRISKRGALSLKRLRSRARIWASNFLIETSSMTPIRFWSLQLRGTLVTRFSFTVKLYRNSLRNFVVW